MGEKGERREGSGARAQPWLHWSLDVLASASESPGRFAKTPSPESLIRVGPEHLHF